MASWRIPARLLLAALPAVAFACGSPARRAWTDALVAVETAEGQGRADEAVRLADALLARTKADADRCPVLLARARALARTPRTAEALEAFAATRDACGALDPESATGLYALAWMIRSTAADPAAAEPYFRAVVRRFPEETPARRSVVALEDLAMRRGGPDAVVAELAALYRAVGRSSVAPYLAFEAGRTVRDAKGDPWRVLALWDLVLRDHPESALANDAAFESAGLLMTLGRYWDAKRLFERVLAARESSWFLGSYEIDLYPRAAYALGEAVLRATGDPAAGAACFDDFVREFPESGGVGPALMRSATLWRQAGDIRRARDRLSEVVRRYPDRPEAAEARRRMEEMR